MLGDKAGPISAARLEYWPDQWW